MELTPRPSLAEMKEKLGHLKGTIEEREYIPCDMIRGGVPRGVISEVTGTARTEWILSFLRQNPSLTTFWAEENLTILPTAILQRGIDLDKILIAETGAKLFQSLRKAMKSKLFDCIVLPGVIEEVKILKALQLFSREANTSVFFLSKIPKNAWAISFQMEANWNTDSRTYSVDILKQKFSNVETG